MVHYELRNNENGEVITIQLMLKMKKGLDSVDEIAIKQSQVLINKLNVDDSNFTLLRNIKRGKLIIKKW